jgi:hypothetical protein
MSESQHPNPPVNYDRHSQGGVGKKSRRRRKKASSVTAVDEPSKQSGPVSTSSNNRKIKRNNNAKKSPELIDFLPQMKIVLRNVGDIEKYGTDEKMASFVRDVIDTANLSVASGVCGTNDGNASMETGDHFMLPLTLDEESIQRVLASTSNHENAVAEKEIAVSDAEASGEQDKSPDTAVHADTLVSSTNSKTTTVRLLVSTRYSSTS